MRHGRSICGEFDAKISQLDAVFCLANSGTKVKYVVNLVEKLWLPPFLLSERSLLLLVPLQLEFHDVREHSQPQKNCLFTHKITFSYDVIL